MLQPKTFFKDFEKNDDSELVCNILEYKICDPEFRFYNVLNLPKAVRGQRKKCRKQRNIVKA